MSSESGQEPQKKDLKKVAAARTNKAPNPPTQNTLWRGFSYSAPKNETRSPQKPPVKKSPPTADDLYKKAIEFANEFLSYNEQTPPGMLQRNKNTGLVILQQLDHATPEIREAFMTKFKEHEEKFAAFKRFASEQANNSYKVGAASPEVEPRYLKAAIDVIKQFMKQYNSIKYNKEEIFKASKIPKHYGNKQDIEAARELGRKAMEKFGELTIDQRAEAAQLLEEETKTKFEQFRMAHDPIYAHQVKAKEFVNAWKKVDDHESIFGMKKKALKQWKNTQIDDANTYESGKALMKQLNKIKSGDFNQFLQGIDEDTRAALFSFAKNSKRSSLAKKLAPNEEALEATSGPTLEQQLGGLTGEVEMTSNPLRSGSTGKGFDKSDTDGTRERTGSGASVDSVASDSTGSVSASSISSSSGSSIDEAGVQPIDTDPEKTKVIHPSTQANEKAIAAWHQYLQAKKNFNASMSFETAKATYIAANNYKSAVENANEESLPLIKEMRQDPYSKDGGTIEAANKAELNQAEKAVEESLQWCQFFPAATEAPNPLADKYKEFLDAWGNLTEFDKENIRASAKESRFDGISNVILFKDGQKFIKEFDRMQDTELLEVVKELSAKQKDTLVAFAKQENPQKIFGRHGKKSVVNRINTAWAKKEAKASVSALIENLKNKGGPGSRGQGKNGKGPELY